MGKNKAAVNRHGLSRTIPAEIKREIRSKCGYGCIICASSIYQYEHIDPEYADAAKHDPDKMALLCASCHFNKTKKVWSKEKILAALTNPKALQQGVSTFDLDVGAAGEFILKVGNTEFTNLERIIEIDNELILGMRPPEENRTPPRISEKFYDRNSKLIAEIIDNEWQGSVEAFDIESEGNKLIVRSKLYNIDLELNANPPNEIKVEKLNLSVNGRNIIGSTKKGFKVITERAETIITTDIMRIDKAPYWINLTDILKLGSDEVMTCVSNGVAQQLPGALAHLGVKTEYLEPEEDQPFHGRPMKITSTEPGGSLMFEIHSPAAKVKKEYLDQSPPKVIDLFNEIEKYTGKEIVFIEKKDLRGHGLAFSENEINLIIYFPDQKIRPPAFAHVLLLIEDHLANPILRPVSDPNGNNSFVADYINTSLSNLVVVPKLQEYGINGSVDWNESEFVNWHKFDPSRLDTFIIRMRCLIGWVNTVNLSDNEKTISAAKRIINKQGYFREAQKLNQKLIKHLKDRERQINCIVKFLMIPPKTAKLVYFNPVNKIKIEKNIGAC